MQVTSYISKSGPASPQSVPLAPSTHMPISPPKLHVTLERSVEEARENISSTISIKDSNTIVGLFLQPAGWLTSSRVEHRERIA